MVRAWRRPKFSVGSRALRGVIRLLVARFMSFAIIPAAVIALSLWLKVSILVGIVMLLTVAVVAGLVFLFLCVNHSSYFQFELTQRSLQVGLSHNRQGDSKKAYSKSLYPPISVSVLSLMLVKILASTLGETGGDAVSMSLNLGYASSTGILFAIFLAICGVQIAVNNYYPFLYWSVIVAAATAATTFSDYLTHVTGLGYLNTTSLLFGAVSAVLAYWYFSFGRPAIGAIASRREEGLYWVTVFLFYSLAAGLGDCLTEKSGIGYEGGVVMVGGTLAVLAGFYFLGGLSRMAFFWAAFILTRPLGTILGDLLTKPSDHGGLNLNRFSSSSVIAALMLAFILLAFRDSEQDIAGVSPGRM